MLRATRMQERRSRRAVAALSAALLIFGGLIFTQHVVEVAHVRDQRGDLVHAQELLDHHQTGPAAHMHGREDHAHASEVCALFAFLHTPAVASRPPGAALVLAVAEELAAPSLAAAHVTIAGYRLAPKTSPPALI